MADTNRGNNASALSGNHPTTDNSVMRVDTENQLGAGNSTALEMTKNDIADSQTHSVNFASPATVDPITDQDGL